MTIGTGAVSLGDIRTEWGRSGAISLGEMYRGGSFVRSKAGNNTGTNLAASVPTSGTISVDNFRGTTKAFRFTFTSTATDQDASALFGDDYAVDYPKEIVINSGVELGATSTSQEALQVDSGGSGTITITNNGTLTGAGGAAAADGGDAFQADIACILINAGLIRSGGGGSGAGGTGGAGGNGSTTSTSTSGNMLYLTAAGSGCSYTCPASSGGHSYINRYLVCQSMMESYTLKCYGQRVTTSTTTTSGGAGGAGGAGAVGQGYNQDAGGSNAGSSGATGGTNAGTGGTGGSSSAGAAFGVAGSAGGDGSTGANGNSTNGAAGASGGAGGAAGASIRGISSVTLTNSGTITGPQA